MQSSKPRDHGNGKNQAPTNIELYELVADELAQNSFKQDLWAKALAEAGDDREGAQRIYTRYRVEDLQKPSGVSSVSATHSNYEHTSEPARSSAYSGAHGDNPMEKSEDSSTPMALRFGRHLVGMAIVALLNPLIYISQNPIADWLSTWVVTIGAAVLFYGLLSLFFTKRAKATWPKSFFLLCWFLLFLVLLGQYV